MKCTRVFLYYVYCVLFSLLASFINAHAQQSFRNEQPPRLDSMIKELRSSNSDTQKVNLLNSISFAYRRNNPVEGIRYGNQGLSLAKSIQWEKGIANSCNSLGQNYLAKSDYKLALDNFDTALRLNSQIKNSAGIIEQFISIGDVFMKLSKYPTASDYYFKALKIAEKEKRKNDIATCLIGIGNIFNASGDYEKALEYFSKGVDNYREIGAKIGLAVTLRNIGNVYYTQNNSPKALLYYQEALNIAREENDKRTIAENLMNISNIYSDKGESKRALEYAFNALEIYKETGNKSGIGNLMGNIGTTYLIIATSPEVSTRPGKYINTLKLNNLNKAIDYLLKALEIEKELGELNTVPQFYENLSEAYALKGDYKNAFDTHKQFIEYKDSVELLQRSKDIFARNQEYEFNKQTDSIKVQKMITEERLTIETKTRKKEKLLYLSGLAALLLVAVFIFRSLRTQQKLNETITRLVSEQEKTIEQRTSDLRFSNEKLRELISFNAHQIREPLTRITGTISIREDVDQQEYFNEYLPQMEKAAQDLDKAITDVLIRAQQKDDSQS